MKKFTTLITVFIFACTLTISAQLSDPAGCAQLGTAALTLNPDEVQKFVNDLPVIQKLGLRVDLTNGNYGQMDVAMRETQQDLLGPLVTTGETKMTTVWGYQFPGLPTTYPGATIVTTRDKRVNVRWSNYLPGHFLPVDPSLHMAHPANMHTAAMVRDWYALGNVPTVTHLHGGHTESASDGLPEAWFTQNFNETGAFFSKKNYRYDNDQQAATLWYHDHALGITRLNVYAGLAGFYLLRDDNENALIANNTIPGGDYEIEIVIQDRQFDLNGQLFWPSMPGETPYDDFIFGEGAVLPPDIFPNGGPSALAEFFGNIILVNGKAWPKLNVEPRKYRFRLLNGSDSRFYILKLDNGSQMMVIGTDNGLLRQPVNVSELVFAPGERYDVVIDFGLLAGNNITMLNLGPDEPYGGGVPGVDFDPACTESTGQIMQFQVTEPLSALPDATVDLASVLNTIDPLANATVTRQLVLFEGLDEFGRLQPLLGTRDVGSLAWFEPITENPAKDATEIWEVYNSTMDAHPIHLHLVKFQIQNRESFTPVVATKPQVQHNSVPGDATTYGVGGVLTSAVLGGDVTGPEPHENGWKDTFIVPPGQVGRVIATFDRSGRYVWHCHILSHEDHEMMRPFQVGNLPPPTKGKKKSAEVETPDQDLHSEFSVYPNPVSGMANVDFVLESKSSVRLQVYRLDGSLILSEDLGVLNEGFHTHMLTTEKLNGGMYLLELNTGDKQFRETIVVTQ